MGNVIAEVTEKVETAMRRLWPYQNQTEFVRQKEIEAEVERVKVLANIREAPDMKGIFDLSAEERKAALQNMNGDPRAKILLEAEALATSEVERQKVSNEVSYEVSEQLNRLTPDSFPREDPDTPRLMHEFLLRFSRAYSKEGKQRSAGPILEYILSANYDHAFWLWKEWIAACIAAEDFASAEGMIAVATDGSTPASHHFATRAGGFKPHLMVAKAMIALHRDGDLTLAHKIACNARLSFGECEDAVSAFMAIEHLRQEEEAGRLKIAMRTSRKAKMNALVEHVAAPAALITGGWGDPADYKGGEE